MKKIPIILFILVFCVGCTLSIIDDNELEIDTNCFEDEIHPVAEMISQDFNEITDCEEVMNWFCNGAEFEDIMNALLTEETTNIDAGELLLRLAEGEIWNDIWIDLKIIEE